MFRPNNLVMGRTFEGHVLDMFELGVTSFTSMRDFGRLSDLPAPGEKLNILFVGDEWETNSETKSLGNMFLDFFRGHLVESIDLVGLEHVCVFYALPSNSDSSSLSINESNKSFYFRLFKIVRQKSGQKVIKERKLKILKLQCLKKENE